MIGVCIHESMTRHLSEEEIRLILDDVFGTSELGDRQDDLNRLHEIRGEFKCELKEVRTYPEVIPVLTRQLKDKLSASLVEAGKSVGVICAQSIGEKQTQMTLNTFHAAGITIETVVTGVPRFLELLNASKEPKLSSTRLFIPKHHFDSKEDVRRYIYKNVLELKFSQFYSDFDLCDKAEYEHAPKWYRIYMKLFCDDEKRTIVHSNSKFIRFKMNYDNLFRYQIHNYEIADRLQKVFPPQFKIACILSPLGEGEMHIYYDEKSCPGMTANDEESDEEDECVSSNQYDDIFIVHKLQNAVLFGVTNIKDFFLEETTDHYIVHTKGNNYIKLMGLDVADPKMTVSNNMWNIYSSLGIEATREFLIQEFSSIISSDGAYINECHVKLLVDIMTFSGVIVSVSRYGMKNDQFGPMAKASFEESLDNFLKASFFAEKERTTDVSASIICGKRSNIGSGLCDVMLDMTKML